MCAYRQLDLQFPGPVDPPRPRGEVEQILVVRHGRLHLGAPGISGRGCSPARTSSPWPTWPKSRRAQMWSFPSPKCEIVRGDRHRPEPYAPRMRTQRHPWHATVGVYTPSNKPGACVVDAQAPADSLALASSAPRGAHNRAQSRIWSKAAPIYSNASK